jgi:hypothetical protein
MDSQEIFTRRYFYPSLASALPYLPKLELPVTEDISKDPYVFHSIMI